MKRARTDGSLPEDSGERAPPRYFFFHLLSVPMPAMRKLFKVTPKAQDDVFSLAVCSYRVGSASEHLERMLRELFGEYRPFETHPEALNEVPFKLIIDYSMEYFDVAPDCIASSLEGLTRADMGQWALEHDDNEGPELIEKNVAASYYVYYDPAIVRMEKKVEKNRAKQREAEEAEEAEEEEEEKEEEEKKEETS